MTASLRIGLTGTLLFIETIEGAIDPDQEDALEEIVTVLSRLAQPGNMALHDSTSFG
jgi:hypothetical protein